jgi:hypothetical protein
MKMRSLRESEAIFLSASGGLIAFKKAHAALLAAQPA